MDIYRVFHPSLSKYTFFSAAHESFSKIDHMLCHKEAISKYKKIEILSCILSDHNGMQLEGNDKNNKQKLLIHWRLNNMLLNDSVRTEDIRKEEKKFLEVNENNDTTYQNLWDTMKTVLRRQFIALSSHIKKKKSTTK